MDIIDFKRILKNHFGSIRISDATLKKFSEDHLARITANNPGGIFTAIAAAHAAAHTAYFGAITGEDQAFAVQQGHSRRVKNARVAFIRYVQRHEGTVRGAFGRKTPPYEEFFPQGTTEYLHMTLAKAEELMNRFIAALQKYAPDLRPGLADEAIALRDDFLAARAAQLAKKGQVGTLRAAADTARTTVELQLLSNLFFIASTYPGDVAQCLAYFDQSILRQPVRRPRKKPAAERA